MGQSDLPERLAQWLSEPGVAPQLEAPVSVVDLERLSGGASRQSFAATLVANRPGVDGRDGSWSRRVVVQRKRPGALGAAMSDEAALVRAAGRAGVPVATVLAATDDPGPIGGGAMVVARVEGDALAQTILRTDAFAGARTALAAEAAAALAAVARIDVDDPTLAWLRHDDQLALLGTLHRGLGRAQPVIELALRWLEANRPPSVPAVVVHGDYRLGNFVVDPGGAAASGGRVLAAVLDWELAHLGDPVEDLAWACVKAWRFGSAQPALGLVGVDDWVAAYVAAGGAAPDRDRLRWWLVYGTLRWAVICELQAAAHLTGMVDSVELAVLGRRVAESEHDLLGLLGMLPPGLDATGPDGGGMDARPHDAPSVDDLLAAVERFVGDTVTGVTTGQVRFHARVAANALAIVRRQLVDGGAAGEAHARRLAALGYPDDAALAADLASGVLDGRLDEVGTALAGAVVDKLAVANPAYLDTAPADPWG